MTEQHLYTLRWKLPDIIFSLIKDWGLEEVLKSFNLSPEDSDILLEYLAGIKFPPEPQLKSFCDRFKFKYYTLKTWDVTHKLKNTYES